MISAEGRELTLLDVMEKFVDFCQTSNGTTDAWELIHHETNSFYGTTFRVKGLDLDSYAYISFSHRRVTKGSTYASWYSDSFHYLSETSIHEYSNAVETSIINSVDVSIPEICNDSGYFTSFSVHKQYSDDIYMCEQGGGFKADGESMNLLRLRQHVIPTHGLDYENFFVPPPYPNMGLPMLCMSDNNIDDMYGIKYYFTRTNNSATITLNINHLWQSISFGLLDGIDKDTYKFPAYVAGGSSGIYPEIWIYTPIRAKLPTYITGNRITFNMGYNGLSTGNMLGSCKVNGAKSNFIVMSADGVWENYYNYVQDAIAIPYHVCRGYTYEWGFPLTSPVLNNFHNSVYPGDTCSDNFVTTDKIIEPNSTKTDNYMMKISPYKRTSKTYGIMGFIKDIYYILTDNTQSGKINIEGKSYLLIPNGWENRMLFYPYHVGVYEEWRIASLASNLNSITNRKFCTIAIKLED